MAWKRLVQAVLLLGIGIVGGIEGKQLIASFDEPRREVLARALSPDGSQECVVERFELPDHFGLNPSIPWRVLKVSPVYSNQPEPAEGAYSSFVMQEHLSGGWEIGGMTNQISWSGTKATVYFDSMPWFEYDTKSMGAWKEIGALKTTQPSTAPSSSKNVRKPATGLAASAAKAGR